MNDERTLRRATFEPGVAVRLADGRRWWIPSLSGERIDATLADAFRAIADAEDETDVLRAELALTIALLSQNYALAPEDFPRILSYRPGDPAQAETRRAIRSLVADSAPRLRASSSDSPGPGSVESPRRWIDRGYGAAERFRWGWSLRSH
jgi:hypothetical protein